MELYAVAEDKSCRLSKKRSGKPAMGACTNGSSGKSRPSFPGRCARLVKEQRARLYIMRRCVSMLVCWRDYA